MKCVKLTRIFLIFLHNRFTPDRLERNSHRFNTLYNGLEPVVTNAVFVYGQHDPWNVIGRTTDLNEDAVAIVITGKSFSVLSFDNL